MNIKKIISVSFFVWITNFLLVWITCGWLFKGVYEIEPKIWLLSEEMMAGNNMLWSSLVGLAVAVIFVGVFAYLYDSLPGIGVKKGLKYGFLVWLVGAVSGMIGMPFYMTIAWTVIIYWIVQSLVLNLINGAIIGAIYKK